MAGSLNKVMLIGNLGRDPESRSFQNGGKVVSLNIATSDSWKDKQTGERKEKTEWHSVQIFNENIGRVAEQYLRKGSKVYIEGALQTRKYTDKNGIEKYSTEIVIQNYNGALTLLDGRNEGAGGQSGGGGWNQDRGGGASGGGGGFDNAPAGGGAFDHDLDDDVPF
jgi:single-strand DNA-binding protein